MKNQKDDLRSRYTDTVIRETLLRLLDRKSIKQVTVAELCAEAKINRGTFYNHFYDLYDVYESIEDELFGQICDKLEDSRVDELDSFFFRDIMQIISNNLVLVSRTVQNLAESSLMARIIEFCKQKYIKEFKEHSPSLSDRELEAMFTYVFNGSIGILTEWIKQRDQQPIEEVTGQIEYFNQIVVSAFLSR